MTSSADLAAGATGPGDALGDRSMVQLLTADGQRVEHPDYSFDPDPDQLRGLYRDLVLIRRFDDEATALQRQGELGLWVGLKGQEAAQIGSGRALRPQDHAFPSYRDHGVTWCRDLRLRQILGIFRGVTLGGWDPEEHHIHLYSIVIGDQALHATGYAMGIQRDGNVGTGDVTRDAAVITYFGDGATSQGDLNEALVFSASFNAPVVFFCQNNQWAISVPMHRQSRIPLYRRADGFGMPGVQVDGNDVLAVYAVTRAALDRARSGGGPMFIEAVTYRMGAHTTSDDPTRYRSAAEVDQWRQRDPIDRMAALLRRTGIADETFFADLVAEAEDIGRQVREVTRSMPEPDPVGIFDHVYSEPHAQVDAERAAFVEYHASFEGEPGAAAPGADESVGGAR